MLTSFRSTVRFVKPTNPALKLANPPPDIVKVRLQTTTQYSSALDCATQIFKNEGPAAFYKGTLTPLIGIGACVSSSSSALPIPSASLLL